jgi:capsular exopolysaccharide synthesis family protein
MSQIFDALLRSEAERGGNGSSTQAEATELLRSVESQGASHWESSAPAGSDGAAASELGATFDTGEELRHDDLFDVSVGSYLSLDTGRPSIWTQFRSLPVAPSANGRLVSLTEQPDATAEAFRLLGVRLRDLRQTRPLSKLLITSTVPQEGKSTVVANLACTLAHKSDEKILLLEGDIRRPSLSRIFQLGEISGICEWLRGERSLTECIYRLEGTGIWALAAGNAATASLELMQSSKLPALMDQLNSLFDWIIIDSPPILPLADTSIWTRIADGILLVTRQGTTEKKQLERGLRALDMSKMIGALLNCSRVSTYSNYYYKSPAST